MHLLVATGIVGFLYFMYVYGMIHLLLYKSDPIWYTSYHLDKIAMEAQQMGSTITVQEQRITNIVPCALGCPRHPTCELHGTLWQNPAHESQFVCMCDVGWRGQTCEFFENM
jgi:hypothetical protein